MSYGTHTQHTAVLGVGEARRRERKRGLARLQARSRSERVVCCARLNGGRRRCCCLSSREYFDLLLVSFTQQRALITSSLCVSRASDVALAALAVLCRDANAPAYAHQNASVSPIRPRAVCLSLLKNITLAVAPSLGRWADAKMGHFLPGAHAEEFNSCACGTDFI